jgi:hypothetical protein
MKIRSSLLTARRYSSKILEMLQKYDRAAGVSAVPLLGNLRLKLDNIPSKILRSRTSFQGATERP